MSLPPHRSVTATVPLCGRFSLVHATESELWRRTVTLFKQCCRGGKAKWRPLAPQRSFGTEKRDVSRTNWLAEVAQTETIYCDQSNQT